MRAEKEAALFRATGEATKADEQIRYLQQVHTSQVEAFAAAQHKAAADLRLAEQDRNLAQQAAYDLVLAQQHVAQREAEATKARVLSDAIAREAREYQQYLQQHQAKQLRLQRQQQADREHAEALAAEARRIQAQAQALADRELAEKQAAEAHRLAEAQARAEAEAQPELKRHADLTAANIAAAQLAEAEALQTKNLADRLAYERALATALSQQQTQYQQPQPPIGTC